MKSREASETAPASEHVWPPPPHDPRERVEIARLGDWEVRSFRPDGVKHRYFAPRGMLHLQLWHPAAGISLLTPSQLTLRRYEVYPIAEWKFAHASLDSIRGIVRSSHGIELPVAAAIRALERWHVMPHVVRQTRIASRVKAANAALSSRTGDEET
jgi:hypothetical protein